MRFPGDPRRRSNSPSYPAARLRDLRRALDDGTLEYEPWMKGDPADVAIDMIKRYVRLRAIVAEVDPEVIEAAEHKAHKRGVTKRLTPPVAHRPEHHRATTVQGLALVGAIGGFVLAKPGKSSA